MAACTVAHNNQDSCAYFRTSDERFIDSESPQKAQSVVTATTRTSLSGITEDVQSVHGTDPAESYTLINLKQSFYFKF